MKTLGLPGTLAPMYQELAPGKKCGPRPLVEFGCPPVDGFAGRLDGCVPVLVEVADGVCYPVHMRLGVQHHVGQHGGCARARHHE